MSTAATFQFRLYVAGAAPNSVMAIANLNALCREHLPNRHEIEILDVIEAPEQALKDDVLLTPTLVKLAPKPVRKIIGNLSDKLKVLQVCGLEPIAHE